MTYVPSNRKVAEAMVAAAHSHGEGQVVTPENSGNTAVQIPSVPTISIGASFDALFAARIKTSDYARNPSTLSAITTAYNTFRALIA